MDWADRIKQFTDEYKVGFDIETKDTVPYNRDSRILTMSFSDGKATIAYPVHHPEANLGQFDREKLLNATREALLKAELVITQNGVFEQEWLIATPEIGGKTVWKTEWGDSMAQAYTMDERKGAKGLDDLTLIHFGCNVKSLSNLDKNNLDQEPLHEVLMYNGMDSKACKLVWEVQRKLLKHGGQLGGQDLTKASETNERRMGTFARMMARGMYPNTGAAKLLHLGFQTHLKEAEAELAELAEVQKYIRQGNKFNPGSWECVLEVLKLCGFTPEDTTEETLSKIKHPFAKLILKHRGWTKLDSTYIESIADGTYIHDDGWLHPRCSHCDTSTGRSAIKEPPAQQWPKREEENKVVRLVFIAPPKFWVVSADFGQLQYRIVGMLSKDKTLVDYCWTEFDIHGHWLTRIREEYYPEWVQAKGADKDPKRQKRARDLVKNQWVFPALFGAAVSSRAGYLRIPEENLYKADEELWNDMPTVKAWQQALITFHRKHRYVETPTGRRRHWGGEDDKKGRPLSPQQVINSPVQGVEADIVMDAQERLDAAVMNDEVPPWCAPHINIHDDLKFYIPNRDSVLADSVKHIAKVMCQITFDFINVPLIVEMSLGKTWYTLEEFAKFRSTDYGHKRED